MTGAQFSGSPVTEGFSIVTFFAATFLLFFAGAFCNLDPFVARIKGLTFFGHRRQKGTRSEARSDSLPKIVQAAHYCGDSERVSKMQRTPAKWCPACAHDHPKIHVFGCFDYFLFERASRLVNHDQNEP